MIVSSVYLLRRELAVTKSRRFRLIIEIPYILVDQNNYLFHDRLSRLESALFDFDKMNAGLN